MGKEMELLKQTLADHKPYAIIVPETSEDELLHFEMQIFQYQKAENQRGIQRWNKPESCL